MLKITQVRCGEGAQRLEIAYFPVESRDSVSSAVCSPKPWGSEVQTQAREVRG